MINKNERRIAVLPALRRCRAARLVVLSLISVSMLVCVRRADAQLANYRLCYTQVVGLPITNPNQPPTIDGVIAGDPGWNQAFRYVFGNGTPYPNAAVQGIRDNTFLYLSIEVNNDATYDDSDVIVIGISPGDGNAATASDDRRIHIYPNNTGVQKGPGSPARQVDYWVNSTTWNNPGAATSPLPAGVQIAMSDSGAPTPGPVSWFVELKLPLAGFDIPATGNFAFYFDVLATNGNTSTVSEYFWPPESGNSIGVFTDTNTPSVATWGNATQDPAATCYGVSLAYTDITSNHSQTQIDAASAPNSNIFTAMIHNNSVDRNGNPIPANKVTAKFSIANFGLPSNWTPIPVPGNPVGPQDIAASGSSAFVTNSWNITDPAQILNFKAHPDQCILVEMDSQAPNVTFVNRSVKRNMWVLTASQVSKEAEISAKGYGAPPAGHSEQEFDLRLASHPEVLKGEEGRTNGGNRVTSRLTWLASGCRRTGQFVRINKEKYEICEDVGAFGAVVLHTGAAGVATWNTALRGKGVDRIGNSPNSYRVSVPKDGVAAVTVNFEALEPGQSPAPTQGANACGKSCGSGAGFFLLIGILVLGGAARRSLIRKERS